MVGLMASSPMSAAGPDELHTGGMVWVDILAMFCAGEYLIPSQHTCIQEVYTGHTFPQPYSQTWTFLPFLALLMRCVVGVYVISSAGSTTAPCWPIELLRDDPL